MANTPNVPKSNKISTKFILGIAGWAIIATAIVAGAGFYFGYQYRASEQAKTSAAVKGRAEGRTTRPGSR
ncbi:MAG TPA: hypothetical protein VKB53_03495 [Gammaproteobacteria bacterium]|nr:hypothetical protein [Gammaproteobacteria bacterium]